MFDSPLIHRVGRFGSDSSLNRRALTPKPRPSGGKKLTVGTLVDASGITRPASLVITWMRSSHNGLAKHFPTLYPKHNYIYIYINGPSYFGLSPMVLRFSFPTRTRRLKQAAKTTFCTSSVLKRRTQMSRRYLCISALGGYISGISG